MQSYVARSLHTNKVTLCIRDEEHLHCVTKQRRKMYVHKKIWLLNILTEHHNIEGSSKFTSNTSTTNKVTHYIANNFLKI